jgi:signal transduction histidine kinase
VNDKGGLLSRFAARYMALIEWFIPEAVKADREASNRARMFLISHSMGPILGNAVPLTVLLFNSTLRLDAMVLLVSITAFWVFPFLLKANIRYETLVMTSVVNLNFAILWSCYFYGGVSSPTLPWLLIIPILSLFYIGGDKRLQPHLLAISAGAFAIFLVLYDLLPPPAMDMPGYAVTGLGIVSTAAALCYVATMAIYYARIFDAGIALEVEVRRRREKMDELREAVAASDKAGSAKSEFLARMSHELRTPLNAVIGYSQILREEAIESNDPRMREDVDRIHEAGTYLLRLVSMILDLSKLEAGRIQFNMQPHAVGSVMGAAVFAKRDLISDRFNSVVTDIDPTLGEVFVDAGRFQQVLEALIENAAQHTQEGLITVRSRAAVLGDDRAFAVSVQDTGGGIDAAVIPTLFETFTATRDASLSRYGGTGLNLTVVHRLCKAMGGSIEVESEVGRGTVFTVTLPLDGRAATRRRKDTPAPEPRRIAA